MTAPARPPAITLLALAAFFSGAALRICDGLIPRLAADFGLTPGVAGRVVLTFSVAYGVMQLLFGPLGDRFGKVRMVTIALFGCAAFSVVAAMASRFDVLLVTRVAWGMAAAGIIPLAMAFIGDAVPYEQRQATLARLLLGTLSGMMAGQLAGGLFADSAPGWRGAFATIAVGYLAVGVLLLARLRSLAASAPAPDASGLSAVARMRSVVGAPWPRVVLAGALAEGVFLLGPMAFLPAELHARFGIAVSAASSLVALFAVGGLLYSMAARRIVTRFGERRMILAGGVFMGVGFALWWLLPVAWLAGPLALVIGFGTYLYHNTLQTQATQMVPAARGTAVSLFASCLFTGQAIGVALAGFAFDRFGPAALLLPGAAALPVVGWLFARAMARRSAA